VGLRWLKKSALKQLLAETPGKVFILQAGVLEYYLSQ